MLADHDPLGAAAGERAHDGRAASDVGPVAHHDAGRDPALHHRVPQGARVEVHEALVHHGRPLGQVGAQAHPVRVADAHPGGHDVVRHARELVHAVHLHGAAGTQPRPRQLEVGDRAGSVVRPHHVGEQPEDAVEVELVRPRQAVREGVQAQPRVRGGGRGGVQVDLQLDDGLRGPAVRVVRGEGAQGVAQRGVRSGERAGHGGGEPHVQDGAVGGRGGQAVAGDETGGGLLCSGLGHAPQPTEWRWHAAGRWEARP